MQSTNGQGCWRIAIGLMHFWPLHVYEAVQVDTVAGLDGEDLRSGKCTYLSVSVKSFACYGF